MLHRVGGHRSGARAAAGTDADAVALGPVDEVGDDEEVAREAHLDDHAGLVLRLRTHLVGDAGGIALIEAVLDLFDEPGLLGLAVRHREARHVVGARVELDLAPLGDEQCVVAGLGMIAEDLPHLGGRLDVVAVAVELEALGVVERRPGLHAQQSGVTAGVVLVGVVQIVGADQRDAEVLGDPQQIRHHAAFDRQPVIHDLGEVVLFAEELLELRGRRSCGVVLAETQTGLHLARRAAGRGDQALAVFLQQLAVHAGLEVVALDARPRREPEEVVHALGRLRTAASCACRRPSPTRRRRSARECPSARAPCRSDACRG